MEIKVIDEGKPYVIGIVGRLDTNTSPQLEEFARSVDLVLFVSGVNSSNGHYLYEYCRKVQPSTRMISSPAEIERDWFDGVERIGITGATSTPRWLMEQVKNKIEND